MSRIEDGGAVEAGLAVERFELDWGDDLGGKGRMVPDTHGDWVRFESWAEAAAEITRLRAENAGMREALTDIVEDRGVCSKCGRLAEMPSNCISCDDDRRCTWSPRSPASAARAALSKASQAEGGEK